MTEQQPQITSYVRDEAVCVINDVLFCGVVRPVLKLELECEARVAALVLVEGAADPLDMDLIMLTMWQTAIQIIYVSRG